ncbi:unnamed protein product [Clonostachys byssicola]|uniref:Serine hydrolase domain-containing protein n=1 Tax=Clonostachys byssicola TaxID=160290 RepID=A0A9N9UPJ8_9HYPO|nr:unnamed protein product [Clonostachys byssicola]
MSPHRILSPEEESLDLPRILCLHGGGVNSTIFRMQCRIIVKELRSTFRLCFADAPYTCGPGPGMIPTYKDYGPFRRWLRHKPEHQEVDSAEGAQAIVDSLAEAIESDNRQGATGEWVGLLGFSQGAKVAASVLLMQDNERKNQLPPRLPCSFRFAVVMAGSAPLITFDSDVLSSPYLVTPAQSTALHLNFDSSCRDASSEKAHLVRSPTVHVHGLRDPGINLHWQLMEYYCQGQGGARLIEWDGDHRLPIRLRDVRAITTAILEVAREAAVL